MQSSTHPPSLRHPLSLRLPEPKGKRVVLKVELRLLADLDRLRPVTGRREPQVSFRPLVSLGGRDWGTYFIWL